MIKSECEEDARVIASPVTCPECSAITGEICTVKSGGPARRPHEARRKAQRRRQTLRGEIFRLLCTYTTVEIIEAATEERNYERHVEKRVADAEDE